MKPRIQRRLFAFFAGAALLFSASTAVFAVSQVASAVDAAVSTSKNVTAATSCWSGLSSSSYGSSFRTALRNKMTAIKTKSASYADLKTLLCQSDQDPNGTGKMVGFYDGALLTAAWDSAATWNREHVWPNSRGVGESGPGSDPHNIRPASVSVNSSRGNNFYGVSESNVTDPGEYKDVYRGIAARIIFYTATLYGPDSSYGLQLSDNAADAVSANTMGKISKLLEWNAQYPVQPTEIVRNEYLYNNGYGRNPFIDNPEYASYIWSVNSSYGGTSANKYVRTSAYTGNEYTYAESTPVTSSSSTSTKTSSSSSSKVTSSSTPTTSSSASTTRSVTITGSSTNMPTSYPTSATTYSLEGVSCSLTNVATYDSGTTIQFKASTGVMTNTKNDGAISSIVITYSSTSSLPNVYSGASTSNYGDAITPSASGSVYTYDMSGNAYFKIAKNTSSAAKVTSIQINYKSSTSSSSATASSSSSSNVTSSSTPATSSSTATSSVTITGSSANMPTSYPTSATTYSLEGVSCSLTNVATFDSGTTIQFKATTGVMSNTNNDGAISSIVITYSTTAYLPKVYSGTSTSSYGEEITPSINDSVYTYNISGNPYFKIAKEDSNAAKITSIQINYGSSTSSSSATSTGTSSSSSSSYSSRTLTETTTYNLVKDVSSLKAGDKVVFASASSGSAYAMKAALYGSTTYNLDKVSVSVSNEKFTAVSNMGLWTVGSGSSSGTYTFNDSGSTNAGYLSSAVSGTYYNLALTTSASTGSSWSLTISSAGACVMKSDVDVYLEYYSNKWCGYKNSATVYLFKQTVTSDQTATEFAENFLYNVKCDGLGSGSYSAATWSTLATAFSKLSSTHQSTLTSATANVAGNSIAQCVARYDYIIAKYGTGTYSDFMSRGTGSSAGLVSSISVEDSEAILLMTIAVGGGLVASGFLFLFRKKRLAK